MRDISRSGPAADVAPTTTAATPQEFLVQELKSKLQAANVRERELHKHLLHHMQEKDLLVNQVAELQRVCEALLLSQMQGGSGPAAEAATAAATRALSSADVVSSTLSSSEGATGDAVNDDTTEDTIKRASAAVGPGAPQLQDALAGGEISPDTTNTAAQQQRATSSSLRAIMGTVASAAPGPKPSPQHSGVAASPAGTASPKMSSSGALKSVSGVEGGTTSVAGSESSANPPNTAAAAAAAAAVYGRAAGTDPAVDIPQLLVERGGRIRITALWEAYQNRFGDTPYSLKDLFSMVKSGAIPHVVHEPPAGIRLLPSAPIYQQRQQQLLQQQLRREQHHQQLQLKYRSGAQASLVQSFQAQGGSAGVSPVVGATSRGVGAGSDSVGHNRHHQQQQHEQQHSFSLPSPLANARARLLGPQPSHESVTTSGGIDSASDGNFSAGWTSGEPSSASAPSPLGWPQPGSTAAAAGDGKLAADVDDNNAEHPAEASGEASGNSSGSGGEDQADGGRTRFGSLAADAPLAPTHATATATARGARGGGPEGRPTSGVGQKREVDWRELNRNLNLLLKEEGEMSGRELNYAFQTRFGMSPYLDGTPLRYAVSAGWLKGVCFDVSKNTYNLTVRVPVQRREDPPEGAPPYPPTNHPRPRVPVPVPRREPLGPPAPSNMTSDDVDWKQLSSEFRQLLLPGALEPKEIHATYHRTFRKPLIIGAGYSMRQAVMDGRLGGITFERGSRRLMCA